MSLRRSTISKIVAVWFVALIVLPFTAPFQTLDLTAPKGAPDVHGALTADKLSTKDITTTTFTPHVVPYVVALAGPDAGASQNHNRRRDCPTVLRL
jgi:hypothetical protein